MLPMKEFIGIESRKKDLRVSEEEEDSLSLSDLILTNDDNDSEEWENKYYDCKSTTCSSSSSSDEDVFEFISNKNNAVLPENILFCGKLIPCGNSTLPKRPEKRSFSSSSRKWLRYCPTHEMELKDLKNRQNRKVASSAPSSKVGAGIGDYKYGKGKGILWSLIKALSCTSGGASYHAQSVVKASIDCISLV
ncbi:hypothetical protein BC332_20810 [Capsicum chinense]|nr:hypothetical protein BC332_20810 [Capsicum chinense]